MLKTKDPCAWCGERHYGPTGRPNEAGEGCFGHPSVPLPRNFERVVPSAARRNRIIELRKTKKPAPKNPGAVENLTGIVRCTDTVLYDTDTVVYDTDTVLYDTVQYPDTVSYHIIQYASGCGPICSSATTQTTTTHRKGRD